MIRGLAFDIEGTLIDLEIQHHTAYLASAQSVGLPYKTVLEGIQQIEGFIGGPDEKVAKSVCNLAGRPNDYEKALSVIKETYTNLFTSAKIELRDGASNFIEKAISHGLKLCLQTGTPLDFALPIFHYSGLTNIFSFETIVKPGDVPNGKPAPDAFIETAKRMGISPQEQLVFGDSTRDTIAATAAGSPVIGMPVYDYPEAWQPLLDTGAKQVFFSWEAIDLSELLKHFES